MRGYWPKILLGALAIFGVGYGAVRLIRGQVHRVRNTIESTDPVSIPLAFLPFAVEGHSIGTYRGVTILRSDPETVRAIRIRVRLADSVEADRLVACRLTTMDATGFNPEEGFRCLGPDAADSALIPFGDVTLQLKGWEDLTLPLLLNQAVVTDLAGSRGVGEAAGKFGRQEAQAARAQAESVKVQVGVKVQDAVRPPKQD